MNKDTVCQRMLTQLAAHDTPTVCNVIELFGIRPRNAGYMDQRIGACFPELPPMVGFAATATFRSAAPAETRAYGRLEDQIAAFDDLPGPAVVVFQDLDDPSAAATFGEIMCTTYQTFGAAGLITSGTGRDLAQVRSMGFPVFTNGAVCAHGYCHFPSLHVPVRVGGVVVHPGDLLHGDLNGITTVPMEIASEVADACDEFVQAEAIVLDYLKGNDVTLSGFVEASRASRDAITRIEKRVARS